MLEARQPLPARTAESDRLADALHRIGREVIGPSAVAVDREARFPSEAFEALRGLGLLGAYVPRALGGLGLSVTDIARACEILGGYCASTAMIFAMHQIQVACLVHHGRGSLYFERVMRELVARQPLIASATTEIGAGGDLRNSVCAVEVADGRFSLVKKAPVISYGEAADYILVTCRRAPDAASADQVHVLVSKADVALEALSSWDTLGFRGTCSSGFVLRASGGSDQILPVPFADILAETMHPVSHIVWASVWAGLAADAVNKARAFVRAEARKNPAQPPISALRLAELDSALQETRSTVQAVLGEYADRRADDDLEAVREFSFTIRVNNLKLSSSTAVVDLVTRAMVICGIAAYRNDSPFSLCRHLRDACGASLMVNNDRILQHNASMLLAHRES